MQDEMGLRISKGSVFVKIYVLSELRHYFEINHAFSHLLYVVYSNTQFRVKIKKSDCVDATV